jgi:DNA-binding HxlR family transcriptional regulator
LTEHGRSLMPILESMDEWGKNYMETVIEPEMNNSSHMG